MAYPTRRIVLTTAVAGGLTRARAASAPAPALRLGLVQSGSVQWIADTIARHRLDAAHGIALQPVRLANTDGGRVALLAGAVDVAVLDWPFVAAQRAAGRRLTFVPLSNATGGVMLPSGSGLHGLAGLKGARLGVAGGPVDKSWLIVRAAARHGGLDLGRQATLAYGSPPLLSAKLVQGELDAVLTFWNFAARLQVAGCRELVSVADCARILGLQGAPFLIGMVFDEDFAARNPAALAGFLAAASAATALLAQSSAASAEWAQVRRLMDAPPDPLGDALFAALRQRFIAGLGHPTAAQQAAEAQSLFDALAHNGDAAAAGMATVPAGVFWHGAAG